jgi:NRPS condensation-like uncharacterized protein
MAELHYPDTVVKTINRSAPQAAYARRSAIPAHLPAPAQDVMNYLFRGQHDEQIRCILALDGRLDAARMARAVRLTLDAEPVLGCRFVEHSWRPYWERRDDLDHLPLCSVVEAQDASALERERGRFLFAPLDVRAGPLVRAGIFRGQADTLCVKVHHVAADGLGTIQYMARLAHLYRELDSNPDYRPEPNLKPRGQSQVFRRMGLTGLLVGLRQFPRVASAWGPQSSASDLSGRAFAIRRIGPERLRMLKTYAHERGAGMNDLLLAAYYRALFALSHPPVGSRCVMTVPVDMRRYLPADQAVSICNLSNVVQIAIPYQCATTFDETLRQVHTAMQALKSSAPGVAMGLLCEATLLPGFAAAQSLWRVIIKRVTTVGRMAPFFSNVGVIPDEHVDFGDVAVVDAVGLGMIMFPPALMLSASTFREVLTLATGYCDTAMSRDTMERLMDTFVSELPA